MATDDIFQNVGSTGNPSKELHQLVQLGRREHWVLEDNVVEFIVDKNLGEGDSAPYTSVVSMAHLSQ